MQQKVPVQVVQQIVQRQAIQPQPQFIFPPLPIKMKKGKIKLPICTSFPEFGDHAMVGKQLLAGTRNYLKSFEKIIKKMNGVKKIKVSLKGNNPHLGKQGADKIKTLLKKSPLFLGLSGLETFLSIKPLIQQGKMTLLFPSEGSSIIRKERFNNVIYFRPSQRLELEALVHYVVNVHQKNKIAVMYESSVWGDAALETLSDILEKQNLETLVDATYPQGTIKIDRAIGEVVQNAPNVVFCLGSPKAVYYFVSNGMERGLHKCLFVGLSHLFPIQRLLKSARGKDIVITSVVPNPEQVDIQIAKEYKKTMQSFFTHRADSPFYFESYIMLDIFFDCLKRVAGQITIEKIIGCLQGYKNVTYKGLTLNFNEQTRTLSHDIWINPGVNSKQLKFNRFKKE